MHSAAATDILERRRRKQRRLASIRRPVIVCSDRGSVRRGNGLRIVPKAYSLLFVLFPVCSACADDWRKFKVDRENDVDDHEGPQQSASARKPRSAGHEGAPR